MPLGVLLLLLPPAGLVHSQQAPPAPTVRYEARLEVPDAPAQFDIIQRTTDWPPGSVSIPHTHGAWVLVTFLAGEVINTDDKGVERVLKAGDTLIERPGEMHTVRNASGAKARHFVSFALPKGAPLTTNLPRPAGAPAVTPQSVVYESRTEALRPPARFDMVQQIVDFGPGAWTPWHTVGGQALFTVLDGSVVLREQGTERTVGPGQTFVEQPGVPFAAGNPAAAATLGVTYILPKGAALITVQPAPAARAAPNAPTQLPRTGGPDVVPAAVLGVGGLAASVGAAAAAAPA
jgi:quercetin dioxygenase-like cupin family protein